MHPQGGLSHPQSGHFHPRSGHSHTQSGRSHPRGPVRIESPHIVPSRPPSVPSLRRRSGTLGYYDAEGRWTTRPHASAGPQERAGAAATAAAAQDPDAPTLWFAVVDTNCFMSEEEFDALRHFEKVPPRRTRHPQTPMP